MASKKLNFLIFFLAVVSLLIFFSRFNFFSKLIDVVIKPIRPVQVKLYKITNDINKFVGDLFLARQLEKSVKELTQRVIELSKQNIVLKELEAENKTLRKLLDFKETAAISKLTIARVLGKASFEPTVLQIDKGAQHNLKVGQAVITQSGILVGKLTKVDQFSSQLLLLTDSRSEISASLATTSRPVGVVAGEKGLSLKLQLIPSDEEMKKGDLIITSGLDSEIPSGLIIGQVEQVNRQPNELFQEAIIQTLIPLKNVTLLAVVDK